MTSKRRMIKSHKYKIAIFLSYLNRTRFHRTFSFATDPCSGVAKNPTKFYIYLN